MYLLPCEWCTNLEISFIYNKQERRSFAHKFFTVEQIISLIVIICNSSRKTWSYFSLFVYERCLVNGVNIYLSMYEASTCVYWFIFIYLSICSSFHLKSFTTFCLHFLCFSYCFPFYRKVRTSKEYARVEKKPLRVKRLLCKSNS